MSDPITRLNAALEGRYAIERELGEGLEQPLISHLAGSSSLRISCRVNYSAPETSLRALPTRIPHRSLPSIQSGKEAAWEKIRPTYQRELMIGAAGTPERSHLAIHSPSAGKSAQLDEACSKWSLTPSSDS